MFILSYIHFFIILLGLCLLFSCFFSASETAMMSLNRYRLRHLLRQHHLGAKQTARLLERPDRLLGVILIGNTFANLLASAIATLLALHFFGDYAVFPMTVALGFVVLVFCEIMPKTLAVLYPERLAFPAAWPLALLLKVLYPFVWLATLISNGFLKILKIKVGKHRGDDLTREEVRTMVHESTNQLALGYRNMMLGVLDLGGVTVNDIKVPRSEILGIDLNNSWEDILKQLATAQHTRLPIYYESIDDVQGILHLRKVLNLTTTQKLNKELLLKMAEEVYFIPDSTPLNIQLINFRQEKKRVGLVVDEYGDIQGLLTLDDILEEIVGEFTTDLRDTYKNVVIEKNGAYIIDGSISIRELNRRMQWQLIVDGPVTLSGAIIEHLETIPQAPICLTLGQHRMEVLQVEENMIKKVLVWPDLGGD